MTHQYMELKIKELEKRIEVLEQETKTEHLQKSCSTCEHLDEIDGSNCYECVKGIRDRYSPQEKTGYWIIYDVHGHKACKCSECDKDVGYPCNDKYCRHCGTKMQEAEESEE